MIHQPRSRPIRSDFIEDYPITPGLDLRSHLAESSIGRPDGTILLPWALWFIKDQFEDLNKADCTIVAVRDDLQKFVSFFYKKHSDGNISGWTNSVTKTFFDAVEKKYRRSSLRRIYATLIHFASYLVKMGLITANGDPIKHYRVPELDTPAPQSLRVVVDGGEAIIEGKEVFDMLVETGKELVSENTESPKSRALPQRDLALIYLLYYTGLRASEAAGLMLSQLIDHPQSGGAYLVNIRRKGSRKSTVKDDTTGAKVYVQSKALQPLNRYVYGERKSILEPEGKKKRQSPYLFLSYRGTPLSRIDVQRIVKKLRLETITREIAKGSAKFDLMAHPHSFRHERVYSLLRAQFSESEVAREVGHKSTAYIGRYSTRDQLQRAERLEQVE